jgi:hypothetical protein
MPDIANQQENLFNDFLGMGERYGTKKIQHLPKWDQLSDRSLLIGLDDIHQSQF